MNSRHTIRQEPTKRPLTQHTQHHNFIEHALSQSRGILRVYTNTNTQSRVEQFEMPLGLLTLELNPSAQRCLMRFLQGILLLEPCISLIYA
jgi:hypothetical protein